MINNDILEKIKERAAKIHADVNQTYDGKPYSVHLNKVAEYAMKFSDKVLAKDDDIYPLMFGAYFHDSIEDARLTYNDVHKIALEYMNEDQAIIATEIVYALTNEKGRNRAERANEKYYEGIRNTPYASYVKLCDRMANMSYSCSTKSRMFKVYLKEFIHFVESINPTIKNDSRFLLPDEMLLTYDFE